MSVCSLLVVIKKKTVREKCSSDIQQSLLSISPALLCGCCRGARSAVPPSLLQMCKAEPGSRLPERSGRTGMQRWESEVEGALLEEASGARSRSGDEATCGRFVRTQSKRHWQV